MYRIMLKSKIHRATVTAANLYYEGSLSLDAKLMELADLLPGEQVQILNVNTGDRIETYVIPAKKGSGIICLNGPAARTGHPGDKIIILSYTIIDPDKNKRNNPKIVYVNNLNKPSRKK